MTARQTENERNGHRIRTKTTGWENDMSFLQRTTQPPQQPEEWESCSVWNWALAWGLEPGAPPGRPEACSYQQRRRSVTTTVERVMTNLVVLADLTDELGERGVDVDALLGRRLEELATEMFREVSALCRGF